MGKSYKIQQSLRADRGSTFDRYMDLVLGERSLGKLLRYEFVVMVASRRSGALGLWLRKKMYPWILGAVGRDVIFGANVTLRHPHKIRIGDGVLIDENVLLDAKGDGNRGIDIADGAYVGRNSIICCKDGDISLGRNANIGFNCNLQATSSIRVGDDNIIAAYTYLIGGGNYRVDGIDTPMAEAYDYDGKGGVVLGDDVWIGAHVSVLDGVTVGNGCVVSAGAVVTRDLPDSAIAMGTPAKVVRSRR